MSQTVAYTFGSGPSLALVGRQEECARLDQLLDVVRRGGGAALALRGEPGVGKSALLDYLVASAGELQIGRLVGVDGESDLPYAGLHRLCRSMVDVIDVLPQPQAAALRVSLGLSGGEVGNRYLIGLAVLSLLSEVAAERPLVCVVDDVQWLDRESTQALAFAARRVGADSLGLVFTSREPVEALEAIPPLVVEGLARPAARNLLDSVVVGQLDEGVRERFLAETRGNPLALIELAHTLTPAEGVIGVVRRSDGHLSGRIAESFRSRAESLPEDTRRLLVLASADPLGDPPLLVRAATHLGLGIDAADAAETAGLFEIRERCSFRHPLVRLAVYESASPGERRSAHLALAEATDPDLDPDRRAWHRGQGTAAPDEEVASELERMASRAKMRGGVAAAGAFLKRAAMLTPDDAIRAQRALAAAESFFDAGVLVEARDVVSALDSRRLSDLQAACADCLQARIATVLCDRKDQDQAVIDLLGAAERLRSLDAKRGQEAQLDALRQGFVAGPETINALVAALEASPDAGARTRVGLLLRGWAELLGEGFPAGTELLREAMLSFREASRLEESDIEEL